MNDFGSVLLGNYEESAEYRNLALGSGAVKVAKDAASVGWSALKWTGRSTGEVVGAFFGMGSDRAIANGRDAGEFLPDVVLLIGTGGLSSAGRATVQGGVAVANGIEKAAVFTKNMVQTAGTMNRGGELAYAGASLGSGASKAVAAARGAEMGNLAREGVSGAREAAAGISEKSVAKDMSPRVKPKAQTTAPAADKNYFDGNSKIKQLDRKGFVEFDGVEFRGIRDLGHVPDEHLWKMLRDGKNPVDINFQRLDGHHYGQIYHRDPKSFIVEMPEGPHDIHNKIQHPQGNQKGSGLTKEQRGDWNKVRKDLNKERARNELQHRGLLDE
jgi:hypothetical protein